MSSATNGLALEVSPSAGGLWAIRLWLGSEYMVLAAMEGSQESALARSRDIACGIQDVLHCPVGVTTVPPEPDPPNIELLPF